jgi:DNA-binding IclR family transcriptional regulator
MKPVSKGSRSAGRDLQRILTSIAFDQERETNRQFVTALARGLEVLRIFSPFDGALANSEIAARTGLPKPTVSRITYTLTKLGYLDYIERLERYRLGPSVLALGYAFLGSHEIRKFARPHMEDFASRTGVTVALAAPDRLSFMMLDICSPKSSMRLMLDIGSRIDMAQTAATAAYLEAIPPADQQIIDDVAADAEPEQWEAARAERERCRAEVREHGFCVLPSTLAKNVHVCATALLTPRRDQVLLFQAYAHTHEVPEEDFYKRIGAQLVELSEIVGREATRWLP